MQVHQPNPPTSSEEQSLLIQEEVITLQEKGAVISIPNPQPQGSFYSTIFLIPKKGGQMRPVINLKRLNKWVKLQHFTMEGIATLKELLRLNDWMVKVDLKDAYFTVQIHVDHHSPTHASISGVAGTLSVHMPAVRPVLCTLGIHQSNETSGHLPSEHGSPYGHLHGRHTPDGRICRAGDASSRSAALPVDRAGVHYQCAQVSSLPHSTDRVPGPPGALYHITFEPARGEAPPHQVGSEPYPVERSGDNMSTGSSNRKLHAISQAVLPAPLFYCSLQGDLKKVLSSSNQDYTASINLSLPTRKELLWWQERLVQWNGKVLIRQKEMVVVKSDTSLQGWGAVRSGTRTREPWSQVE